MDFEKLGVFYLGRALDAQTHTPSQEPLLYESRHLTTHAVCVGMTGSGKSGLGLALLEEAAIDGVPALIIDPKGDLANLLLTFEQLSPAEFLPWIDPDEALRRGITPEAFAAEVAGRWRAGLAEWGQGPERIARLRSSCDFAVYTPGSRAGLPLSLLRSFAPPPAAVISDPGLLRERIGTAVSGVLTLLGLDTDPLRSREHILLSTILDSQWQKGSAVDLASLIRLVQSPPFDRVGVFDLESFFAAKDRMALAMSLNNLLASPGFAAWTEGEPLDIARLLRTPQGKPRVAVLSIAHLSDTERMFFVTTLLNEVVSWMRAQPGTSSLRAVLYMDEIFGYFPPTANPPSKAPMLTLLKQARAYGLGVVLATQNPVDLDYKGLANAGTWFIGRMQTERDKARVLDGLEGAMASSGHCLDRRTLDTMLSSLGNRVFLLHDVHASGPTLFQTRWTMSYLRGPMTREQIQSLMANRAQPSAGGSGIAGAASSATSTMASAPTTSASSASSTGSASSLARTTAGDRPLLPPDLTELFVVSESEHSNKAASSVLYRPGVIGSARLHFVSAKAGLDQWQAVVLLAPLSPDDVEVSWDQATRYGEAVLGLDRQQPGPGQFAQLPAAVAQKQTWAQWRESLQAYLYQTQTVSVWRSATLKVGSRPGESEADFRARLADQARLSRDAAVDALRRRYAPKVATLEERLRRAEAKVDKEQAQYQRQTMETALDMGATVLGALFGRKLAAAGNVGRARTAARGVQRTLKEKSDIASAHDDTEVARQRLADLTTELEQQVAELMTRSDPALVELERIDVRPRKGDITLGAVGLVWTSTQVDGTP